jgi:hypothetical protein
VLFDQSHTGQGGNEPSGGVVFSSALGVAARLEVGAAGGRWGAGRGGIAAKFETVTWMVELPFAFPIKPDTSIVNES